jgi:hypothetical protein
VLTQIESLLDVTELEIPDFMSCVESAQAFCRKAGYSGILFGIDELGKFLEYEARHFGANDIYLLQALAEHACAGSDCNVYLLATLHQSFDQYARGLGEHLRAEWSKVQGRFEEIPFLESQEQVLRVVSHAFISQFDAQERDYISSRVSRDLDVLCNDSALPAGLPRKAAQELFERCYPLSPVVALVLPVLCQKIAQNERTLFSYLGSHEDFGLQALVNRFSSVEERVELTDIFDYFVANQSAALGDYTTHRRWAEVMTAIERAGELSEFAINTLKTIGLLNIIGARDGLKASDALLRIAVGDDADVGKCIEELKEQSLITFRRFSGEYRVWQGSDFDLEQAYQESLGQLGDFDLADLLNGKEFLQPIVARRYTIKNGALRFFVPQFVDARGLKSFSQKSDTPRLVLYLATNQSDQDLFFEQGVKGFDDLDLVALCGSSVQLRESTREVLALQHVASNNQRLASDPVAIREHSDRLDAALQAQITVLKEIFDSPQESRWYHRGTRLNIASRRDFQESLSDVLASVYRLSPTVHNELVNRDKPSSNANAARIKLLHAMLEAPDRPDLGMDKFPPEKAIYRSVLHKTELHKEWSLNEYRFVEPDKSSPFFHVWQRIDEFLDATEEEPQSFAELNKVLMAPPYGVKAGLLPIIYTAVYCSQRQHLAVYENRRFKPNFTHDMMERFVKRPDEFTFQRFRIIGLNASIYDQYKSLFNDDEEKTVLQLVKPLAELIGNLDDFTQQTKGHLLSVRARRVRDAFKLAKSPHRLLFDDLPEAMGYSERLGEKDGLQGFASELTLVLRELKYVWRDLRNDFTKLLAQSLHMPADINLEGLRKQASGRYQGLDQHTVDIDGVKAFIKRITNPKGSDEEWLSNVLLFLGRKPASKWTDTDRAEAELRLSDFAKRILDLETLRLHYDKNASKGSGDVEVILLKSLRKGKEPRDEVVAIDRVSREAIKDVKAEMQAALEKHTDRELRLAILAELVDEFLDPPDEGMDELGDKQTA